MMERMMTSSWSVTEDLDEWISLVEQSTRSVVEKDHKGFKMKTACSLDFSSFNRSRENEIKEKPRQTIEEFTRERITVDTEAKDGSNLLSAYNNNNNSEFNVQSASGAVLDSDIIPEDQSNLLRNISMKDCQLQLESIFNSMKSMSLSLESLEAKLEAGEYCEPRFSAVEATAEKQLDKCETELDREQTHQGRNLLKRNVDVEQSFIHLDEEWNSEKEIQEMRKEELMRLKVNRIKIRKKSQRERWQQQREDLLQQRVEENLIIRSDVGSKILSKKQVKDISISTKGSKDIVQKNCVTNKGLIKVPSSQRTNTQLTMESSSKATAIKSQNVNDQLKISEKFVETRMSDIKSPRLIRHRSCDSYSQRQECQRSSNSARGVSSSSCTSAERHFEENSARIQANKDNNSMCSIRQCDPDFDSYRDVKKEQITTRSEERIQVHSQNKGLQQNRQQNQNFVIQTTPMLSLDQQNQQKAQWLEERNQKHTSLKESHNNDVKKIQGSHQIVDTEDSQGVTRIKRSSSRDTSSEITSCERAPVGKKKECRVERCRRCGKKKKQLSLKSKTTHSKELSKEVNDETAMKVQAEVHHELTQGHTPRSSHIQSRSSKQNYSRAELLSKDQVKNSASNSSKSQNNYCRASEGQKHLSAPTTPLIQSSKRTGGSNSAVHGGEQLNLWKQKLSSYHDDRQGGRMKGTGCQQGAGRIEQGGAESLERVWCSQCEGELVRMKQAVLHHWMGGARGVADQLSRNSLTNLFAGFINNPRGASSSECFDFDPSGVCEICGTPSSELIQETISMVGSLDQAWRSQGSRGAPGRDERARERLQGSRGAPGRDEGARERLQGSRGAPGRDEGARERLQGSRGAPGRDEGARERLHSQQREVRGGQSANYRGASSTLYNDEITEGIRTGFVSPSRPLFHIRTSQEIQTENHKIQRQQLHRERRYTDTAEDQGVEDGREQFSTPPYERRCSTPLSPRQIRMGVSSRTTDSMNSMKSRSYSIESKYSYPDTTRSTGHDAHDVSTLQSSSQTEEEQLTSRGHQSRTSKNTLSEVNQIKKPLYKSGNIAPHMSWSSSHGNFSKSGQSAALAETNGYVSPGQKNVSKQSDSRRSKSSEINKDNRLKNQIDRIKNLYPEQNSDLEEKFSSPVIETPADKGIHTSAWIDSLTRDQRDPRSRTTQPLRLYGFLSPSFHTGSEVAFAASSVEKEKFLKYNDIRPHHVTLHDDDVISTSRSDAILVRTRNLRVPDGSSDPNLCRP